MLFWSATQSTTRRRHNDDGWLLPWCGLLIFAQSLWSTAPSKCATVYARMNVHIKRAAPSVVNVCVRVSCKLMAIVCARRWLNTATLHGANISVGKGRERECVGGHYDTTHKTTQPFVCAVRVRDRRHRESPSPQHVQVRSRGYHPECFRCDVWVRFWCHAIGMPRQIQHVGVCTTGKADKK